MNATTCPVCRRWPRGRLVSIPFGDNERYDCLVETPRGDQLRIQIKTGRYRDGAVIFDGVSQHTNTRGSTYKSYRQDIDFFMVYNEEVDELYLVDAHEVRAKKYLRVDPPKIDHPSVTWAKQYRFDDRWPPRGNRHTITIPDELPPHRKGDATEAIVIAELLKRNVPFAIPPTDNERYDLVLLTPENEHLKIQIKTGWIVDGCIHFQTVSIHTNGQGTVYKPYDGHIDYFLVYEQTTNELYLIAEDAFNTNISLRVEEPTQVHRDTKWAVDYQFDKNWPPSEGPTSNPIRRHPRDKVLQEWAVERLQDLGTIATRSHSIEVAYDLLAETPKGGFVRLTICTCRVKDGRIFFSPEVEQHEQIDQYLLYCFDLDTVYLIDSDDFDTSITLWIDDPMEIRATTKWAEDFELERRWPPTPGPTIPERSTIGICANTLGEHEVEIAYPADEESAYDLLAALDPNEFSRIGVEPGWIWNGRIRLKPESKNGIDAFLVHCRENDETYLIQADEFKTSISLRVEPAEHDPGTINWAEEYTLAART